MINIIVHIDIKVNDYKLVLRNVWDFVHTINVIIWWVLLKEWNNKLYVNNYRTGATNSTDLTVVFTQLYNWEVIMLSTLKYRYY